MVATSFVTQDTPFESLFVREYAGVVAVAYRVLGDRADAEDVAQEVFARYVGSRSEPAAGALRLAASRRALNLLRSRQRRIARELRDFRLHAGAREDSERGCDPLALLDRASQRMLVRTALVRLNRRDAEILTIRYGGASYRDIAQTLGIDPAQVGMRLARAERAFKREIERATT
jgi:RNA polymerase sigma-70 factor (ECF subfamily)